jgi:hypothetical protein
MKKLLIAGLLCLFANVASAQNNPCNQINQVISVPFGPVLVTSTQIVTNAATTVPQKQPVICSFFVDINGAAAGQVVTFQFGTGVLCATNAVAVAVFNGSVTVGATVTAWQMTPMPYIPQTGVLVQPANNLCVILSTATPITGYLTYVMN